MGTIKPKGEKIREAVKWISGERQEDEGRSFTVLISQACLRFNLSPLEEAYLRQFYKEER